MGSKLSPGLDTRRDKRFYASHHQQKQYSEQFQRHKVLFFVKSTRSRGFHIAHHLKSCMPMHSLIPWVCFRQKSFIIQKKGKNQLCLSMGFVYPAVNHIQLIMSILTPNYIQRVGQQNHTYVGNIFHLITDRGTSLLRTKLF